MAELRPWAFRPSYCLWNSVRIEDWTVLFRLSSVEAHPPATEEVGTDRRSISSSTLLGNAGTDERQPPLRGWRLDRQTTQLRSVLKIADEPSSGLRHAIACDRSKLDFVTRPGCHTRLSG